MRRTDLTVCYLCKIRSRVPRPNRKNGLGTHCHPCENAERRRQQAAQPKRDCACGCGAATRPGRIFVNGHNGRADPLKKFTVEANGCWFWIGTKDRLGYGLLKRDGRRHLRAHRVVYELLREPIAPGLEIDHLCRNTSCVNPDHLEPVSHAVNMQRGSSAKLTKLTAAKMRSEYLAAPKSPTGRMKRGVRATIAARWGVSRGTVDAIARGRWA